MAYVGFDDNGYEYLDENKFTLFTSDNTHHDLFDYITKDLEELPKLFEEYISNRMNTTNFKLKNFQDGSDDINAIIEKIKPIHPYFEYDYKRDLKNKIGNYFNNLLIYTIATKNRGLYGYVTNRNWYDERLSRLMSPTFYVDELYSDILFNNLMISLGDWKKGGYTFIHNVPKEMPKGFVNEIKTQNAICNLLYFVLDISAPNIDKLSTFQRVWLYGNMFHSLFPAVSVTQNFLFVSPTQFRKEQNRSQEPNSLYKAHDIFDELNGLPDFKNLNAERNGTPESMAEQFNSVIKYANTVKGNKVYEEYKVSCLQELLYLEIMSMIQSGTMIRKCKNCGKYYVVNDKRIVYCNRINENGQSCSEIGKKQRYSRLKKKDKALALYDRAYKAHHNRILDKKGRNEFLIWCDEAKKKRDEVRSGHLELSDFEDWLNKTKNKSPD